MVAYCASSDDEIGNDVPGDYLGISQLVDNGRPVDLLLRPYVLVVKREEVQKHKECFHHDKLRRENVVFADRLNQGTKP